MLAGGVDVRASRGPLEDRCGCEYPADVRPLAGIDVRPLSQRLYLPRNQRFAVEISSKISHRRFVRLRTSIYGWRGAVPRRDWTISGGVEFRRAHGVVTVRIARRGVHAHRIRSPPYGCRAH